MPDNTLGAQYGLVERAATEVALPANPIDFLVSACNKLINSSVLQLLSASARPEIQTAVFTVWLLRSVIYLRGLM